MHLAKLLVIAIGVFSSGLAYAQDEIMSEDQASSAKMVIVEPTHTMTTEIEGEYRLVSHRERRSNWGMTASLLYSSFEPVNYEPNFAALEYKDVYTTPEMPMIEMVVSSKMNLELGSVGIELGFGGYKNESDHQDLLESSLLLIPVRLGLVLALDNIGPEALLVPYVSLGAYTVFYREGLGGNSFNGNTQPAPYFHGGLAVSLDWIDRRAARIAYEDSGIQSSYVFAEARKQMASDAGSDPDFESDIYWAAGVRVEF
jgi:hypothetical protein